METTLSLGAFQYLSLGQMIIFKNILVFFTGGGVVCQTAAKKCEVKLERLATSTVNGNSSSSNSNNSNNSTMSNNTDSSKFKRPLSSSSIKNDHDDDLRPPGKYIFHILFLIRLIFLNFPTCF